MTNWRALENRLPKDKKAEIDKVRADMWIALKDPDLGTIDKADAMDEAIRKIKEIITAHFGVNQTT